MKVLVDAIAIRKWPSRQDKTRQDTTLSDTVRRSTTWSDAVRRGTTRSMLYATTCYDMLWHAKTCDDMLRRICYTITDGLGHKYDESSEFFTPLVKRPSLILYHTPVVSSTILNHAHWYDDDGTDCPYSTLGGQWMYRRHHYQTFSTCSVPECLLGSDTHACPLCSTRTSHQATLGLELVQNRAAFSCHNSYLASILLVRPWFLPQWNHHPLPTYHEA